MEKFESDRNDSEEDLRCKTRPQKKKHLRKKKLQRRRFRHLYRQLQQTFEEREKCKVDPLDSAEHILEADVEGALALLEDTPKRKTKEKVLCTPVIHDSIVTVDRKSTNTLWYLPTYIPKFLRNCILTQDWDNVTYLLLLLLEHNPTYLPHIKKVAFLNFLKNPSDGDVRVLEEFLQLCFVKVKPSTEPPSFDVCYKELME